MTDERVRQEIWTSFTGLLRSHLAALEVTRRLTDIVVVQAHQDGEIEVRAAKALLAIRFDAKSGTGVWACAKDIGSWSMSTGAVVELDGQTLDMELAVEHFAAKLLG